MVVWGEAPGLLAGLLLLFLLLLARSSATMLESRNSPSPFTTITTSGLSSGAFAAVQLHVAFSSRVAGAGVIAGGPFFCAQDNLPTALSACMKTPALISVPELVQITRNTQLTGTIDATRNLAGSRVFVFSGLNDTVVVQGVGEKLVEYYESFHANVSKEFRVEAEHAMPLGPGSWDGAGANCLFLGSPYMNRCGYDGAAALLDVVVGGVPRPAGGVLGQRGGAGAGARGGGGGGGGGRSNPTSSNLRTFDQLKFLPVLARPDPASIGMGDHGFLYVPPKCEVAGAKCHLHVAFHGCLQSVDEVGMDFADHAGYNECRDDLVVLYPQARKAPLLGNPKGCWDWWGYTGTAYASQIGTQPASVWRMVEAAERAQASGDWESEFGGETLRGK